MLLSVGQETRWRALEALQAQAYPLHRSNPPVCDSLTLVVDGAGHQILNGFQHIPRVIHRPQRRSTVTRTDIPGARLPSGSVSKRSLRGTRWTTFTQLPLAFSGAERRTANRFPMWTGRRAAGPAVGAQPRPAPRLVFSPHIAKLAVPPAHRVRPPNAGTEA